MKQTIQPLTNSNVSAIHQGAKAYELENAQKCIGRIWPQNLNFKTCISNSHGFTCSDCLHTNILVKIRITGPGTADLRSQKRSTLHYFCGLGRFGQKKNSTSNKNLDVQKIFGRNSNALYLAKCRAKCHEVSPGMIQEVFWSHLDRM